MSLSSNVRRAGMLAAAALATSTITIACGDSTGPNAGGTVVVRLTDAPLDSVQSVNVWVVRIDAKSATTDSVDAAAGADSAANGWTTIAEPDTLFDLLALRTDTATVGVSALPGGHWRSLRIVIDPLQSYVILKDGTRIDGVTNFGTLGEPGIKFPSAATSGIKVHLDRPLRMDGDTSVVTVDFDAGQSFVARGTSPADGFLFRPVVRAMVK